MPQAMKLISGLSWGCLPVVCLSQALLPTWSEGASFPQVGCGESVLGAAPDGSGPGVGKGHIPQCSHSGIFLNSKPGPCLVDSKVNLISPRVSPMPTHGPCPSTLSMPWNGSHFVGGCAGGGLTSPGPAAFSSRHLSPTRGPELWRVL